MRIAFVTSELSPHAHVGGLGDVSRWLPAALAAAGEEVRVFLPCYDVLDPAGLPARALPGLRRVESGPLGPVGVRSLGVPAPGEPSVLLIDSPRWFRTGGVYHGDEQHLRYGALSAAVPAVCAAMDWVPEVVHANDWHTGLLALHLEATGEPWAFLPLVFTIHNLAYQGLFPAADLEPMGLGDFRSRLDPMDLAEGWVNSLKTGIATAAVVTTVSPTFARDMLTPEHGMGLDAALRARGDRPVGILNGIGDDWDPAADPLIARRYRPGDLQGKADNTAALRRRLGLTERAGTPVLGVVSRMDRQKGFDLLWDTLPPLLRAGRAQLAALGTGDPVYEGLFASLAERHPREAAFVPAFDPGLAHLIEAGADMFLMPSVFEPSGLNQMYSMRYGTVPVVHRTGGLADSVAQWNPETGRGTGFLFSPHTPRAFASALEEALAHFADRDGWRRLVRNGMRRDFSWRRRAGEYLRVYRKAVERRNEAQRTRAGGRGR